MRNWVGCPDKASCDGNVQDRRRPRHVLAQISINSSMQPYNQVCHYHVPDGDFKKGITRRVYRVRVGVRSSQYWGRNLLWLQSDLQTLNHFQWPGKYARRNLAFQFGAQNAHISRNQSHKQASILWGNASGGLWGAMPRLIGICKMVAAAAQNTRPLEPSTETLVHPRWWDQRLGWSWH
jgi:hypothetical protein